MVSLPMEGELEQDGPRVPFQTVLGFCENPCCEVPVGHEHTEGPCADCSAVGAQGGLAAKSQKTQGPWLRGCCWKQGALPQTDLCSSWAQELWAGKGTGRHWKIEAKRRNKATFSWQYAGISWPSWPDPLGCASTGGSRVELTWACLKMCMMNMVRPSPKM